MRRVTIILTLLASLMPISAQAQVFDRLHEKQWVNIPDTACRMEFFTPRGSINPESAFVEVQVPIQEFARRQRTYCRHDSRDKVGASAQKLSVRTPDQEIRKWIKAGGEFTPGQLAALIDAQRDGKPGILDTAMANVLYVIDPEHRIWTMYTWWDSERKGWVMGGHRDAFGSFAAGEVVIFRQ